MFSIDGLATGIDTTKIIEGLLSIHEKQIGLLQNKQREVVAEQTAFKGIEAKLLNLQGQLSRLARSSANVFDSKLATSSDDTAVAVAASDRAALGTYNIRVNSLARAHQIASKGLADEDASITQGTFSVQLGTGTTTTVTIDDTNDTLRGLADAINGATTDVSATIINDGGATPYRLLITANKTGADNTIQITNNLAADSGGAVRPVIGEALSSAIGAVQLGQGYSGTSTPTSNEGTGSYSGAADDTYTFTVTTGGTVGTDTVEFSYQDGSGENSGTIQYKKNDVDTFVTVAEGVQIKLNAGTLVNGETFTVNVTAADPDPDPIQAATDASVTLGSGSGAITVTNDSNIIDDLIVGVTLDLKAADGTKDIVINVNSDTETAKTSIEDFVTSFNELMEFIDDRIQFDPETDTASTLLGNRSVTAIQDEIRRAATDVVVGVGTQANRLSAIGITVNSQGRLDLNAAELDDALSGQLEGITMSDIRRLFALDGVSDHSGIRFVSGTSRTQENETAYQVDITQAAEKASITAANATADSIVIDGTNNGFSIRIDNKDSSSLSLADGTYTRQQLADHLEAVINSDSELAGRNVTVTISGDKLQITSETFGQSSEVTILSGSSLTDLGFDGTETDVGVDVAGKFIVDGQEEAATGIGRLLAGDSENDNTADLQILVTLTPSDVEAGAEANLTITRGLASRLVSVLNSNLDPVTGRLETINDSFEDQIESIVTDIERQNERFESRREALVKQFAGLESAISQLRTTSDFLAAQLGGVSGLQLG